MTPTTFTTFGTPAPRCSWDFVPRNDKQARKLQHALKTGGVTTIAGKPVRVTGSARSTEAPVTVYHLQDA